jgi:hypothetical protein
MSEYSIKGRLADEARIKNELWIVLRDALEDMLAEHGAPLDTEIVYGVRMEVDKDDDTKGSWMVLLIPKYGNDNVSTENTDVAPYSAEGQAILRRAVRQALSIAWAEL